MSFANAAAFNDPRSRLLASGANLNPASTITNSRGNTIGYVRTGGMINPMRHELLSGEILFRFGGFGRNWQQVASGNWWVGNAEFKKILGFANTHGLSVGVGMRYLCLVPLEWSDVSILVRARVTRDLLAWRGLANTVTTPTNSGDMVRMPHQNEIASRRCHQLCIPGLGNDGMVGQAIQVEEQYPLSVEDSRRGFLYR